MGRASDDNHRLRLADPRFSAEASAALDEVLASGRLTEGPKIDAFERAVAELAGAQHAVATTSATTAIELVLASIGVGRGDEVIVADFTYPATGNAVLQRGAIPVLVDVDPDTWCLDPLRVDRALNECTAAVISVDVFGLPADYPALEPLLGARGVPLICDAACSLGGAIAHRPCGSFGLASCFSFHPRKSLTTGEGGMVTTDDEALAKRMRRLRNHGVERHGWRSRFVEPGFNYRMSELAAALGLVQVPAFRRVVDRRRMLAARLTRALAPVDGVRPQLAPEEWRHPYQSYVVSLDERVDRALVIERLAAAGVEATLGTYALHAEPAFRGPCGTSPGDLPRSYALAEQSLALPLHHRLSEDDVERVAATLAAALDSTRAPAAGGGDEARRQG